MSAIAGDLPGYEEAIRRLFAGNIKHFRATTKAWPADIREYAMQLAEPSFEIESEAVATASPLAGECDC